MRKATAEAMAGGIGADSAKAGGNNDIDKDGNKDSSKPAGGP